MLTAILCCILCLPSDDHPPEAPLTPLHERHNGVPAIRWAGGQIDEAMQEAEDRKVPLLLWVLRDGDPASEAWAQQRILDPQFISTMIDESVPAIVWLPAKDGTRHTSERVRDSKEKAPRIRCPQLLTCDCQQHLASEVLLEKIEVPDLLPAAFLITAKGEVTKLADEIPFQGAIELGIAVREIDGTERSTRLQLEFIEIRLERAVSRFKKREIKLGRAEVVEIQRQLPKFGPRIHRLHEAAARPYLAYGKQMLRQAKILRRTDPARGLLMLRRIVEDLEGLPPATTANALIRKAVPD